MSDRSAGVPESLGRSAGVPEPLARSVGVPEPLGALLGCRSRWDVLLGCRSRWALCWGTGAARRSAVVPELLGALLGCRSRWHALLGCRSRWHALLGCRSRWDALPAPHRYKLWFGTAGARLALIRAACCEVSREYHGAGSQIKAACPGPVIHENNRDWFSLHEAFSHHQPGVTVVTAHKQLLPAIFR